MLAGDTLRSAADLGVPMVAITLLRRKGYFRQSLDAQGTQSESPAVWSPENIPEPMKPSVSVSVAGRQVLVKAWRYLVEGITGHVVPVYLLDTAIAENTIFDQSITDHLYGGDAHYRLCQEVVLGMEGVEILRRLRHHHLSSYHLNEGHPALLSLALLEQRLGRRPLLSAAEDDLGAIRHKCVFTTHTPVPAGHDDFPLDLVRNVLGVEQTKALEQIGACPVPS